MKDLKFINKSINCQPAEAQAKGVADVKANSINGDALILSGELNLDKMPNSIDSIDQTNDCCEVNLSSRRVFLQQASAITVGGLVSSMVTPLRASAAFIGFWKKKVSSQAGTLWAWGEGTSGQIGNGAAVSSLLQPKWAP